MDFILIPGLVMYLLVVLLSARRLLKSGDLWRMPIFAPLAPSIHDADEVAMRYTLIPALIWAMVFLLAEFMLLWVSLMAFFYAFGLFHTKFIMLMSTVEVNAGNVIVHLCYPLIVFVMGLFVFILFFGTFTMAFGDLPLLSRFQRSIRDVRGLVKSLAGLLGLMMLIEFTRIAAIALLVDPPEPAAFFRRTGEAWLDPFPLAVIISVALVVTGLWLRWAGGRETE